MRQKRHEFDIGRRQFLQLTAGGLAALMLEPSISRASSPYLVGIGSSSDPYTATQRAVAASTEWPATTIAGRTVVIKPNLVSKKTAQTGVTTDPQVVRAVVDLALAAGATSISIIEGGPNGAQFTSCGYDFFNTYDPRVSLIDLNTQATVLQPVPNGMVYRKITLPTLLFQPDVVYISVAKLKTHVNAMATLTMKNSFGLPPIASYQASTTRARFAMHDRGVHQTIVDLNLVRPINFAVVDGIWGLEGNGPLTGTPVAMNLVVAGSNPVAVDRICVDAMMLPPGGVQYLDYAAQRGLGPGRIGEIRLLGDSYTPYPFILPATAPVIVYPQANPPAFNPTNGQITQLAYSVDSACQTRIEIVQTSEISPKVKFIRVVRDWTSIPAGTDTVQWDGRDGSGNIVPPTLYSVRVRATYGLSTNHNIADATGSVKVTTL